MENPIHREWILDTIDQLRGRKARPDLERICHMLERKYGLSSSVTESCLERLVDSEIVMKVDYKGNTSYRHAAKWRKSHLKGVVMNSTSASRNLVEAVLDCESSNTDELSRGASIRDIELWFQTHETERLKCPINVALQREIDAGRIEKLNNGNYSVRIGKTRTPKNTTKSDKLVPSRRGRPPKNKKKLKRNYSYEDDMEYEPPCSSKKQYGEEKCDFCSQTAEFNKLGVPEFLLICKDCNAKAHPSCMEYTEELSRRAYQSQWQCIDCKTCCMCDDSGDPDLMLFCDGCDKGYHMNCHQPPVPHKPQGKWICAECEIEGVSVEILELQERILANKNNVGETSLPLTPCESPQFDHQPTYRAVPHIQKPKILSKDPKLDGVYYPDASDWSIEDVVSFIASVGFLEQSQAFREQEIDGKSLLLMKRSDVLTGLSIRLGPALKIYKHVQKLQTASQDIR
ncbi:histone acetyltransferase KAT6B [Patella vulgata]|uniref:histone acetyltransferase KAT6B n=1 Tax=Patella vulgata TaxID=6465 RepID=UPI00217F9265|nr:histone acetyltransferase KAT6B [Patella vulgata]